MDVLLSKKSGSGTNRGFRVFENKMYMYLQERTAFSYIYPKRKVLYSPVRYLKLSTVDSKLYKHFSFVMKFLTVF
jgi:hypothetical protein